MNYRVLLPEDYDRQSRRYAVLYLLHGVFGDHTNWDSLTGIAEYAQPLSVIVAMPDGDNSWYTNSATVPADRFEDYIVSDFVGEIERQYRTVVGRNGRAVAGLSMGGYAAVKFALRYPDRFLFAGSISGAFDGPSDLHERRSDLRDKLLKVYGPTGSATRIDNDVYRLARTADPSQLPHLYIDCGLEDEFLPRNREFAALLRERSIRFEYVEAPGGHEWPYWDRRIQPLIGSCRVKFSGGH